MKKGIPQPLRGLNIKWRTNKNKDGETVAVPVIDVRDGEGERKEVDSIIKASNGNQSKYFAAKRW